MAMSTPLAEAPLRPFGNGGSAFRPVLVSMERCKGCGLCVDACAPHVLALDVGSVNAMGHHPVQLTDPGGCTSCAKCARVCPDAALTIFAPARKA
jgi:2-oxoglutarate ferredoxin oxidoreductase subunit delta